MFRGVVRISSALKEHQRSQSFSRNASQLRERADYVIVVDALKLYPHLLGDIKRQITDLGFISPDGLTVVRGKPGMRDPAEQPHVQAESNNGDTSFAKSCARAWGYSAVRADKKRPSVPLARRDWWPVCPHTPPRACTCL